MHQLGILSAVMPEWAPCTGRVQHDLYHVYTVDQHQLYAVAMLKRIARGELAGRASAGDRAVAARCTRPAPLLLGTLLHDVGKPLGKGHAEKGAVVAGAIARAARDVRAPTSSSTEFLVRQHLTMSHLSQRRDLADPEVIARFAERVGDDERLVQLYLLTLCDTAMTAPDNLSAWKDGLLRDLMLRTRALLPHRRARRGRGRGRRARPRAAARKIVQLVATDDAQRARSRRRSSTASIRGCSPSSRARQAARHVRLVAAARAATPHVALEVHCFPLKGHSELAIVAPDAPGVLAAIAGALTANRVDVLGAVLGHVELAGDGRLVTDVFYVRDLKGAAIADDDPRWQRLLARPARAARRRVRIPARSPS